MLYSINMQITTFNRPSNILIVLSVLILVLGIGLAFFLAYTAHDLRHDAGIINDAGSVRGGIQRLSKLVISDGYSNQAELIAEIDNLILQLNVLASSYKRNGTDHRFYLALDELNTEWSLLKIFILKYQNDRTDTNSVKLLDISESIWMTANNVVFLTQYVTEKKVKRVSNTFYLLLVLNVISVILVISIILFMVRKKLEYESSHDMLTGLLNRRSYEAAIAAEAARAVRYFKPVSLVLFDIDKFKQVNDVYGHRRGDEVLKKVAELTKSSVRAVDSVYRVGGEEFAIISPDTEVQGAEQQAEKVRSFIEEAVFDVVGKVTISLGVAQYSPSINTLELYQQADKALYAAKNNGRNRVCVFLEGAE